MKAYIAPVMIFIFLTASAHARAEGPTRDQIVVDDNDTCLQISANTFFFLPKGTATISIIKRSPRLTTVSYLEDPNREASNQIDIFTFREQTAAVAEGYFLKASEKIRVLANKSREYKELESPDANLACSQTAATKDDNGKNRIINVMCYIKTNSGTHTFHAPLSGATKESLALLYKKAFSETPCNRVVNSAPAMNSTRVPASSR